MTLPVWSLFFKSRLTTDPPQTTTDHQCILNMPLWDVTAEPLARWCGRCEGTQNIRSGLFSLCVPVCIFLRVETDLYRCVCLCLWFYIYKTAPFINWHILEKEEGDPLVWLSCCCLFVWMACGTSGEPRPPTTQNIHLKVFSFLRAEKHTLFSCSRLGGAD